MARPEHNSNLVFVHHKRTGEVAIRRSDGSSKRPKTPQTPMLRHIHYTDQYRSKFCRCRYPTCHECPSQVASESAHLAANLTRYLVQHCREASSMVRFRAYKEQQQADWAHEGICINDFHYATRQKDVVCRCTKPNNHGQGWVRNPEIMELCAEYFRINKSKMTCAKAQWYTAGAVPIGGTSSNNDSFKYDSLSVKEVLHNPTRQILDSPMPSPRSDMIHFRSGPNENSDIPEQVWVKARPSLWNGRRGSETCCSTPLGIAATPQSPVGGLAHPRRRTQSMPLNIPKIGSVSTAWSAIQRNAAGEAPEVSLVSSQASLIASRAHGSRRFSFSKYHVQDNMVRSPLASQNDRSTSLNLENNIVQPSPENSREAKGYLAKLPVHRTSNELRDYVSLVELPTETPQSMAMHSPTLTSSEAQNHVRTTTGQVSSLIHLWKHQTYMFLNRCRFPEILLPFSDRSMMLLGCPIKESTSHNTLLSVLGLIQRHYATARSVMSRTIIKARKRFSCLIVGASSTSSALLQISEFMMKQLAGARRAH
jgi:hypothetical protein